MSPRRPRRGARSGDTRRRITRAREPKKAAKKKAIAVPKRPATKKIAKRPATKKAAKKVAITRRPATKKAAKKVATPKRSATKKKAAKKVATLKRPAAKKTVVPKKRSVTKKVAKKVAKKKVATKRPASTTKRPTAIAKRPAKKIAAPKRPARSKKKQASTAPVRRPARLPKWGDLTERERQELSYSQARKLGREELGRLEARRKKILAKWHAQREKAARAPNARDEAREVASAFRMYLSNVVDELGKNGISSRYRVSLGPLLRVDAELRVVYPDWVKNVDDAVQVLSTVEEALENIPNVQWISVGFTLHEGANETGVRKGIFQYLKYEGERRLNPEYYERQEQGVSFQLAHDILRSVQRAHGMLPTGMLVRFAWSPDGGLWRKEDREMRNKK